MYIGPHLTAGTKNPAIGSPDVMSDIVLFFYKDNTIEAFLKAILHNFDMIEFDIQLTKDEKIIIYHDTYIKNTNNSYFIIDLTYEEIKSFICRPVLAYSRVATFNAAIQPQMKLPLPVLILTK